MQGPPGNAFSACDPDRCGFFNCRNASRFMTLNIHNLCKKLCTGLCTTTGYFAARPNVLIKLVIPIYSL